MTVRDQIKEYIAGQPGQKRSDLKELHRRTLEVSPGCKLWFDEGKDARGKTVTNPTIGYGLQTLKYADGKTRDFFRIGISANTTGISVYILGLENKTYLKETYGKRLGKAVVTGYCIKFKALKDIDVDVLEEAIQYGLASDRR